VVRIPDVLAFVVEMLCLHPCENPCAYLSAVQHVREATVEPGFTCAAVVPSFDRLIEHMSIATAQTSDLCAKALASVFPQLDFAPIPQIVSMRDRIWYTSAGRLDHVFLHRLRL